MLRLFLYIKNNFIYNNFVVYAFIIICFIVFFPLKTSGYFYCDGQIKKPIFRIDLFGFKIFGGYMRFNKGTLFIHYKENKAKAVELIDAKSMKFDLKSLKYLSLTEFKTKIDLETSELSIIFFMIYNVLDPIIGNLLNYRYPILDFNNDIILNDERKNDIFIKISILFNIFDILLIIIKTLWGNIWNLTSKKKG